MIEPRGLKIIPFKRIDRELIIQSSFVLFRESNHWQDSDEFNQYFSDGEKSLFEVSFISAWIPIEKIFSSENNARRERETSLEHHLVVYRETVGGLFQ